MTTPTDLEDLLCRWHDLRRQGRDCSAEELCAGQPELAAALARDILELERMEELMPLESFAEASPSPKAGLPGTLAGYEILEKLGEGSMGIVYRARECASGRVVALKTMKRISPESLQRFRSEWRIMHAIRHPNLVSLYDMKCDSEQWFFTMQFLQGQPFLNDLCAGPLPETSPVLPAPSSEPSEVGARNVIGPDATSASPAFSPSRVRDAFRQLAGGISKMHEHGVLHRDIKPSNVMETVRGEVVLLDYGLAAEAALDERSVTQQGIEGTMLYMAPEQADGRPVKASDWYSFGVMLFLALTGRHPFEDTEYAMPWTRKDYDSPAPHCLVPGIPEDLGWLCAELLRADPSARPSGQEVCCRLVPVGQPTPVRATSPAPVFLAREGQLADLTAAYADARNGRTVTILLHGPSGIGKSALVRHFVSRLRQTDNRVRILEGRCYERESVPYKALDGLVESLRACEIIRCLQ